MPVFQTSNALFRIGIRLNDVLTSIHIAITTSAVHAGGSRESTAPGASVIWLPAFRNL